MLPKRLQSGSNRGPKEGPEFDFQRIFDRFENNFSLFFMLPAIGPRKAGGMCVAQGILEFRNSRKFWTQIKKRLIFFGGGRGGGLGQRGMGGGASRQ